LKSLLVLTTGGTIDKVYFDANSQYEVGDPVVADVLKAMNVSVDFTTREVCRKDSLEINDDDRRALLEHIQQAEQQHILVTHGTDTMIDTALSLGQEHGKTVVFTGAMQPAAFKETDGIFNIGSALGALAIAPPGVYVAMNGKIFTPDKAFKNYETRRFEDT